jgi:hypothetical protein
LLRELDRPQTTELCATPPIWLANDRALLAIDGRTRI